MILARLFKAIRSAIKQTRFINTGYIFSISNPPSFFVNNCASHIEVSGFCFSRSEVTPPNKVTVKTNKNEYACTPIFRSDVVTFFAHEYPNLNPVNGFHICIKPAKRISRLKVYIYSQEGKRIKIGSRIVYKKGKNKEEVAKPAITLFELFSEYQKKTFPRFSFSSYKVQEEPQRRIYFDATRTILHDSRTGIQRVVRSILIELMKNPPTGYLILPVFLKYQNLSWNYFILKDHNDDNDVSEVLKSKVTPKKGDMFLGIDLSGAMITSAEENDKLFSTWSSKGVNVIFLVHDLLPIKIPGKFPSGAYLEHLNWFKTICRVSNGLLCVSKSTANDVLEAFYNLFPHDVKHVKVGYFQLGSDIENSAPTLGLPGNYKQIMEKVKANISFLVVGTIEPRKGHLQILGAFENLWEQNMEVNLIIVGKKGWMVDDVHENIVKHRLLGQRLYYLADISDEFLMMLFKSCTCLLFASEAEGFGLPVVEATRYNIPLILRDIPVFREITSGNAFFFTGSSPEALSTAIQNWIEKYYAGTLPDPRKIKLLSWNQSTRMAMKIIQEDQWQFKGSIDSLFEDLIRTGSHSPVNMKEMATDADWEEWGKTNPYFGVLTNPKYLKHNLTDKSLDDFFKTGDDAVAHLFNVILNQLDPDFNPERVLDFGCGTGRLLIPFAKNASEVVGLDISESMLEEARKNCNRFSISNVTLLKSDDSLSKITGRFDLVHSCIVFQHIPVARGRVLFRNLIDLIHPAGVGAIHITYAKSRYYESFGLEPLKSLRITENSEISSSPHTNKKVEPGPVMQMNSYLINELFFMIQQAGIQNVYSEFSDHGGELGVYLFFRKPADKEVSMNIYR